MSFFSRSRALHLKLGRTGENLAIKLLKSRNYQVQLLEFVDLAHTEKSADKSRIESADLSVMQCSFGQCENFNG